jgi:hypothetical protein
MHYRRIRRTAPKPLPNSFVCSFASAPQCYTIGQLLEGAKHPAIYTFCRVNQKYGARILLRFDLGVDFIDAGLYNLNLVIYNTALRMLLRGDSAVEKGISDHNDDFRHETENCKAVVGYNMQLDGTNSSALLKKNPQGYVQHGVPCASSIRH